MAGRTAGSVVAPREVLFASQESRRHPTLYVTAPCRERAVSSAPGDWFEPRRKMDEPDVVVPSIVPIVAPSPALPLGVGCCCLPRPTSAAQLENIRQREQRAHGAGTSPAASVAAGPQVPFLFRELASPKRPPQRTNGASHGARPAAPPCPPRLPAHWPMTSSGGDTSYCAPPGVAHNMNSPGSAAWGRSRAAGPRGRSASNRGRSPALGGERLSAELTRTTSPDRRRVLVLFD